VFSVVASFLSAAKALTVEKILVTSLFVVLLIQEISPP
jgi:hypothetical protein